MIITARFGGYRTNPLEANPVEIELPDDTLFFTGGLNDIGPSKHDNAYHYIVISQQLTEKNKLRLETTFGVTLMTLDSKYISKDLKLNGFELIEFYDCIIESDIQEYLITEDRLNELLNPQDYIFLSIGSQFNIMEATRINRISSAYIVDTDIVTYTDVEAKPNKSIIRNDYYELSDVFHCRDGKLIYGNSEYMKKLYDQMINECIFGFQSQYNLPYRYDLDWLFKNYESALIDFENHNFADCMLKDLFIERAEFKKELPLKS